MEKILMQFERVAHTQWHTAMVKLSWDGMGRGWHFFPVNRQG